MNEQEKEKRFVEKIRRFLDESAESLSTETGLRLREVRFQAVNAAGKKRGVFAFPRWITVGGLATATTAVLAIFFWFNVPSVEIPAKQVEDFEILTSREQIDFYKDLDFFLWLAAKENGK
jgi:hypothetical protein